MVRKKKRPKVLASNYTNAMKVARFEYKNVSRVKLVSDRKLPNKLYEVIAKRGKKLKKR